MELAVGGLRRRPLRRRHRRRPAAERSVPRQRARCGRSTGRDGCVRTGCQPPRDPSARIRLAHLHIRRHCGGAVGGCDDCVAGRRRSGAGDLPRGVLDVAASFCVDGDDHRHLLPLSLLLLSEGVRSPNLPCGHCHYLGRFDHSAGDRHRDHGLDAATSTAGRRLLRNSRPAAPRVLVCRARRAQPPNGNGWPGKSTTPSHRDSPASSRSPRPSSRSWTPTPRRPSDTSSSSARPHGRISPKRGRWWPS